MYTHELILCINSWKLFRKIICDMMHHKSYDSGITAINEVRKRIVYKIVNIIISSH